MTHPTGVLSNRNCFPEASPEDEQEDSFLRAVQPLAVCSGCLCLPQGLGGPCDGRGLAKEGSVASSCLFQVEVLTEPKGPATLALSCLFQGPRGSFQGSASSTGKHSCYQRAFLYPTQNVWARAEVEDVNTELKRRFSQYLWFMPASSSHTVGSRHSGVQPSACL